MSRLSADARHTVRIEVNGRAHEGEAEPRMLLTDFLRHRLGLTGTHVGCEHGVCGACTIQIDGAPARACLTFAVQADGASIRTVEGLAPEPGRSVLQEAFRRHHALQCGFCTAGILMSLDWYFGIVPDPTEEALREFLSGHICRCTGYVPIVAAALDAAQPFVKRKGEPMKWCRYSVGGVTSFGLIQDDTVIKVDGPPWGEHTVTGQIVPLANVKLEIPAVPSTFFCVGVNYRDHVERMAAKRGTKPSFPPRPDIGYRANNALIAHEENIVKPRDAGEDFEYEGELVAVFGKRCRNVSKEEALSHVFGWTIGNDVSERGWQANDRTLWRAKNSDTFKPMGPWIVTGADLDAMVTTIKVNGAVTEAFKTNNMIFDAPTYISEVSRYCTIEPGDVMWMGTDGVPSNMKPGDVCEIEITGIGVLRNPVVGE